jgi:hypothetical protein
MNNLLNPQAGSNYNSNRNEQNLLEHDKLVENINKNSEFSIVGTSFKNLKSNEKLKDEI